MFNKYIKIAIAALIVGYSGYQFVEGNIGNGISLILLSLVFIFLYFRNEMILLAFLRMRSMRKVHGMQYMMLFDKRMTAHSQWLMT